MDTPAHSYAAKICVKRLASGSLQFETTGNFYVSVAARTQFAAHLEEVRKYDLAKKDRKQVRPHTMSIPCNDGWRYNYYLTHWVASVEIDGPVCYYYTYMGASPIREGAADESSDCESLPDPEEKPD